MVLKAYFLHASTAIFLPKIQKNNLNRQKKKETFIPARSISSILNKHFLHNIVRTIITMKFYF